MRLLLLRHGQTQSNVIGALDTAIPGAPLNALGLRQAAAVPGALKGQEIDAISASTIERAQQTAAPLAADRGIAVDIRDGLREIAAGDLEMLSDHKSQGIYTATAFAWAKGDLELRMPEPRPASNSSTASTTRSATSWRPRQKSSSLSATALPSAPGSPRAAKTPTEHSPARTSSTTPGSPSLRAIECVTGTSSNGNRHRSVARLSPMPARSTRRARPSASSC